MIDDDELTLYFVFLFYYILLPTYTYTVENSNSIEDKAELSQFEMYFHSSPDSSHNVNIELIT